MNKIKNKEQLKALLESKGESNPFDLEEFLWEGHKEEIKKILEDETLDEDEKKYTAT